jgi:hypothetical protein
VSVLSGQQVLHPRDRQPHGADPRVEVLRGRRDVLGPQVDALDLAQVLERVQHTREAGGGDAHRQVGGGVDVVLRARRRLLPGVHPAAGLLDDRDDPVGRRTRVRGGEPDVPGGDDLPARGVGRLAAGSRGSARVGRRRGVAVTADALVGERAELLGGAAGVRRGRVRRCAAPREQERHQCQPGGGPPHVRPRPRGPHARDGRG